MPDMDQGIKRLIQSHPEAVLALALPDAEYLGTLPVDVATEPQLTLDTLLRALYHAIECAINIEAEARPRPGIGRRLFEYGARVTILTGLPVLSIVFWLEPNGAVPRSPYELWLDDRLIATWSYIGVELYAMRAEDLLASDAVALLPLVPFTQGGAELEIIEQAAVTIKDRAPAQEIAELENLLAVFAGRRHSADVVRALIGRVLMSTEIIETSSIYQEALARGLEQGLERGLEQGLERGLEQGTASGMRDALRVVLEARFGPLGDDLAAAIVAASSERLREALPAVATEPLATIRARFGL